MITIEQLKDVKERTAALERYLDIEGKKVQVEEEQLRTQAPGFWDDAKKAEAQMKKVKDLQKWIEGYKEVKTLADELELSRFGGYILAYNGGQIIDCLSGNVVYESLIPTEYFSEVCGIARGIKCQPLTYFENKVVAESDTDFYVKKEIFNNSATGLKVERLDQFMKVPVPKFMIVGESEQLKRGEREINERFQGKLRAFFSEPYFLEVVPEGIDKAKSLDVLATSMGLTSENVMAIGDGLNDIPMLQYAGLAVAMGNAYPEVKQIADEITLTNDEDGVAKAVEKLILQ